MKANSNKLFCCNIHQNGLSSTPPRLRMIRVRKKSEYRKKDNMLTSLIMSVLLTII